MRVEKSFSAFTLAEVLITLGIIGVVAAMTMPTLINQTNGAQYKAAYKKALSAISQAVTLNVALDDVGFAEAGPETVLNGTTPRMNIVNSTTNADDNYDVILGTGTGKALATTATKFSSNNTTLYFNDGSVFSFKTGIAADTCTASTVKTNGTIKADCRGVIDVNGKKGPNKETKDPESPSDIYPVYFYDQTILPATQSATEVLYAK